MIFHSDVYSILINIWWLAKRYSILIAHFTRVINPACTLQIYNMLTSCHVIISLIYIHSVLYLFSVSLWRRANARNVRLYYPYWQYTDLYSAYAGHYVYFKRFCNWEFAVFCEKSIIPLPEPGVLVRNEIWSSLKIPERFVTRLAWLSFSFFNSRLTFCSSSSIAERFGSSILVVYYLHRCCHDY